MAGTLTEYIEQTMDWDDSEWSAWSSPCPPGTVVCALMTRVQPDQGSFSYDVALTDVKLYCCN